MTKGEYPLAGYDQDNNNNGITKTELLNPENVNNIYKPTECETIENNVYEKQNSKLDNPSGDIENNNTQNDQINIAEYVQNLPNSSLRQKIARILSTDAYDEIDIGNIEHYLLVGRRSNSTRILKSCENKLLSNLNSENCESYLELAGQFDLNDLKKAASVIIENINKNHIPENTYTVSPKTNKRYKSYNALFTCGTSGSKRTVTTVVYDTEMKVRSYKDLQKGTKISKHFQCCCLQNDEDEAPVAFWSFGKSVYSYDPVINKCKKRASFVCKRSKFCMEAHADRCFAIGGVYKGRKVLEIEEYSCRKNSWKIVARLPGDCLPIDASCVVYGDLIYIFCAILTIEGEIKPNATAVHIFHPIKKTVKLFSEIPISFNQTKTCVHDSFIYIASDKKHFIKYFPLNGAFSTCREQTIDCKDFGMFSFGNSICLAGGTDKDGKCNDVIRTFCTTSGQWENDSQTLPDGMAICGALEIKIPNSAEMIVPFYETNVFEKT